MLITDSFVFAHLPKTGGTFVTRVMKEAIVPNAFLRKLHEARRKFRVRLPMSYRYRELPKHTFVRNVPPDDRGKPVISCCRNPLDLWVSHFKFGWWRENLPLWFADLDAVESAHGPAIKMTLEQFVRASYAHSHWATQWETGGGQFSTEWVHFFCPDAAAVFQTDSIQQQADAVRETTPRLSFLRQENLNHDTADFLESIGVDAGSIRSRDRILPGKETRPAGDGWRRHFDADLEAFVRDKEALLFTLFDERNAFAWRGGSTARLPDRCVSTIGGQT